MSHAIGLGRMIVKEENKMQRVWRSLSKPTVTGVGFYIWEVLEVMGEPLPQLLDQFTKTSDGGYVYVMCVQFFSEEKALEYLNSDDGWDQKILIIGKDV